MDIFFEGLGTLKALSLRKEGENEDQKEVAASLKIELDVKAHKLQPLVGSIEDELIEKAFWDEEGNQRFFTVKSLEFTEGFKDHRLNLGNELFTGVTLTKFIIVPRGDRFATLTFMAHINPNPTQLSRLGDLLTEDVSVKVQGHPTLI